MYYVKTFLTYSILGYLLETLVANITKTSFKSGILFGYWTPIYGIGALIILFISKYLFNNLHMNRIIETMIVFIVVSVILSTIEVVGGITIEKIFKKVLWDYSKEKYNIGKYASLKMTLIWGSSSILFIYIINPLLKNIVKKIPNYIAIFLIILFLIDCTMTIIIKSKI